MITIRYYTSSGIYKGWNKYTDKNIQEAKEWDGSPTIVKLPF